MNCFVILLCLASITRGATLEWDYNRASEGVTNYGARAGTNSGSYSVTNYLGNTNRWQFSRLTVPRGKTNYFAVTALGPCREFDEFGNVIREWPCESELSKEVFYVWPNTISAPVTSLTLRVPSGKFYVERSGTTASWAALQTVTGPTNISFPITGTMGFYRYRPYFITVANPQGGAAKLMAAKKPMFKATVKPMPFSPTTNATPRIGPVNLDPSKAPR